MITGAPDGDADVLRLAASAANEAVDAVSLLPAPRLAHGIGVVAHRYARALAIGVREMQDALQAARLSLRSGARICAPARDDTDEPCAAPPASRSRSRSPAW